ncbi:hypothetical protein COU77_02685 [Candidatus Peregrinibacteria bacterium CG10_big_fil_rev_8_21_14_0_10_49_16]|nr:MAG: hypothetical protein COW95_02195 [Candidatus Peregrinibacteria bacterium CG22_combo_CG10-13_8_21_14_all_49_11]PIR51947.1 MAG: hypothetical protein COU77_02685 [Candidatus Peregrinibacteria bacterium CG10_big_fil_rev_8_21_14_0_10_49_16]
MIESSELLTGVYVVVGVLIIVVLYHVLFIVVNLRKVIRRIESVTAELESVVIKPLNMVDTILEWVAGQVEKTASLERGKKKK